MDAKECREAFEAEYANSDFGNERNQAGEYLDGEQQRAWLVWQAAWNRRARLAEPEGEPVADKYFELAGKYGVLAEKYVNTLQAISDPENQPSQHGTVTLAYMKQQVAQAIEDCAAEAERQAEDEPYGHAKFRCANIAAAIRYLDKTRDIKEGP